MLLFSDTVELTGGFKGFANVDDSVVYDPNVFQSLPPGWKVEPLNEPRWRIVFDVDFEIDDPLSFGAILSNAARVDVNNVRRYSVRVGQSHLKPLMISLTVTGLKWLTGFDVRSVSIISVSPVEG